MKQIICINWGVKYGPRFINRLYAMVARNITPPFTFTCFCDNPEGIRPEVRTEPIPDIDFELPKDTPGIWPKARLWGAELGGLKGPVLFMDLDMVVTGNLDGFFTQGDPEDVILARNPTTPLERLGQTSIFRFPVGKLAPLQERFLADPQAIADEYRFEQRYVTKNAPGGISFWPRDWVMHFRYDCARPIPMNFFLPPRLDPEAKVVIFPGGLMPQHAINGQWGKYHTPNTPMGHLRGLFSSNRPEAPWSYLRHYIRPSPWVAEAWREDV